MTINQKREDGILTIIPEGRLDSMSSDGFLTYVREALTEDTDKLIFDFSGIDFISSKGLRILVTLYKEAKGLPMEIIGANTSVHEVFRITGLMKVFNVQ